MALLAAYDTRGICDDRVKKKGKNVTSSHTVSSAVSVPVSGSSSARSGSPHPGVSIGDPRPRFFFCDAIPNSANDERQLKAVMEFRKAYSAQALEGSNVPKVS